MSGVIDENGVQWEHCNVCTKWVKIQDLGYEPPSAEYDCGRDICLECTNKHPNIEIIIPAKGWIPRFSGESECQHPKNDSGAPSTLGPSSS